MKKYYLSIICFFTISAFATSKIDDYFNNLKKIKTLEKKHNKRLPIIYNQTCQSGYFTMPSAKMNDSGVVAFNYTDIDPYKVIGFNMQYLTRLELSLNIWIFKNIMQAHFGYMGYGEDTDRAANLKFSILNKKDGFEKLPEVAIGFNDFIGSKRFHSKYVVLTKEFLDQNLEVTLGYGQGRIDGFFAAAAYFPFLDKEKFFSRSGVFIEYDANNYKKHNPEHPKGKDVKFPVNVGVNFQMNKYIQGSLSTVRGKKLAGSIGANYNIGETEGLFPKYLDPPLFEKKEDFPKYFDEKNLAKLFNNQKLELTQATSFIDDYKRCLALKILNVKYRNPTCLKERIQNILCSYPLDDFERILVSIESDGIIMHEYEMTKVILKDFSEGKVDSRSFNTLCPFEDPKRLHYNDKNILYHKNKSVWIVTIKPKMNAFFSSCKGKFKYDAGFTCIQEGFLFDKLYYNFQLSYILKSASAQVGSRDKYNPSQIINVRSDFVKYFETNSFYIDNLYFQKNYNLKKAFFGKISAGYFELAYAGVAAEVLYYPINLNYAFSFEGANVYKRKYSGMGFQKKIRKWNNITAEYERFIGYQYFFNLFFEMRSLDLVLKTSIGQFLARDRGVKFELFKYFRSGFEVSTWMALTDGKDRVNYKRYFDKGFSIRIPLDIFMNKSSRVKTDYKISEWLRDVGAKAYTGRDLYTIIRDGRCN